jgi:hypothetical protein
MGRASRLGRLPHHSLPADQYLSWAHVAVTDGAYRALLEQARRAPNQQVVALD